MTSVTRWGRSPGARPPPRPAARAPRWWGATPQFTATLKDSAGNVLTGRTITWASSAGAVATVNGSGLVSGVAAGVATITATSEGQSGSAAVTVTTAPVAAVTVNPSSVSQPVGATQQFAATLKDASG